MNGWMLQW
jgi:hypothetical protein